MKYSKRKILIFTKYYLPGFKAGGPIRSVSNMVSALSDDFDFYIVTSDRDSFETKSYKNIIINQWNKIDNYHVFYTDSFKKIGLLKKLILEQDYSILYLNSFLSPYFSILPLLLFKWFGSKCRIDHLILAPRGELALSALGLKSFKKRIYIKLFNLFDFSRGIVWQASSEFEKKDILQKIKTNENKIKIVQNLPRVRNMNLKFPEFIGVLKIICIARITPVKNIDYAIEVLSKCKSNIELNLYGLRIEEDYWEKVQNLIVKSPKNVNVNYRGIVENKLIPDIISKHHLFFLPTMGENYGHAIVESFLCGIPVLISNQTPWRNLEKNLVGWDFSLSEKHKFTSTIDIYFNNLKQGQIIKSEEIRQWFLNEIDYEKLLMQNRELFN